MAKSPNARGYDNADQWALDLTALSSAEFAEFYATVHHGSATESPSIHSSRTATGSITAVFV